MTPRRITVTESVDDLVAKARSGDRNARRKLDDEIASCEMVADLKEDLDQGPAARRFRARAKKIRALLGAP